MEILLREKLEKIMLGFADIFPTDEVSDSTLEDALQDALDAIESLLESDRITADWLITEYDVIKDTTPDLPAEDLLKRLAGSVNEKLRSRDIKIYSV